MGNGGRRLRGMLATLVALAACLMALPAVASADLFSDYSTVRADWGFDGVITPCYYAPETLQNARTVSQASPSDSYTSFPSALDVEIARLASGQCPSGNPGIRPVITFPSMRYRFFRVSSLTTPIAASSRIVHHPLGTSYRFRINKPATVLLTVQRTFPGRRVGTRCLTPARSNIHHAFCVRAYYRGSLVRYFSTAGYKVVPFSGRFGRRPLASGSYRTMLQAFDTSQQRSYVRYVFQTVVPV